ncbi:MAG: hypothetical protein ACTSU5_13710 [Promethearchaeota archaeon]
MGEAPEKNDHGLPTPDVEGGGADIHELEEKFKDVDPWQQIGFSRTLGGFFYQYVLFIIGLVIGAIFFGFLLNLFYPWPEAEGYRNIVGALFVFLFTVFDVGTAYGIQRFIAEWRIKDPRKMIKYVQFFIWYQMMTGLIQTTGISIWALFFVPETNLSYAVWLMLVKSTTQYPGMLGYFRAALKGLQRFDKEQILRFISDQFFQQATNVVFILLGRYLGARNPQVGELMGLAIGAAIGNYVDDFFAMWLGAHYFKKTVRDLIPDVGLKDCFGHDFDWPLVKECVWFGLQVSAGPLVGVAVGQTINLYWINLVPQYSTWIQLSGIAAGIANIVQWGTGLELVPAISESFLNDKKKLAQFYVAQSWRWNFFLAFPLVTMLAAYLPIVLSVALNFGGAENYLLAVPFIVPWLVAKFLEPIAQFADKIIVGASKPRFLTYSRVGEEIGKLVVMTLFIPVWHLTSAGFATIVWLLPLGTFIPTLVKTIASWIYVHKRIIPASFPWGQALLAPLASSGAVFGVSRLYIAFAWPVIASSVGIVVGAALTIVWMLVGTFSIYMFFYGFFGGFDDFGLKTFHEAVEISGPSRPLMKFIGFFLDLGAGISPLHNRFPIPSEDARREALELMAIRQENDERILGKQ